MYITIEKILFFDPQDQPRAQACPNCGGNLYSPGLVCLRCCRRDRP